MTGVRGLILTLKIQCWVGVSSPLLQHVKDLLYSKGNCAQYFVITFIGRESEDYTHTY